jgi:hypothetical protein
VVLLKNAGILTFQALNLIAMKSIIVLFCVSFFCGFIMAQDCSGYYYLNNGSVEMTSYDRKQKENGKVTYTISNINKSGGVTTASFQSEMVDEKGKSLSKSAGVYKCNGGSLFIDARVAMPQEQMAAYKDMEVKAEEVFIEYPSNIAAGQSLKDLNFKMDIINKGSAFSSISLDQTNRKVEGKETVTTPAGTWDCWKIIYDGRFRATIGGPTGIGMPVNFKCTEWLAPGFGIVKTETYNKNGKLMGSTLITAIKK